MKLSMADSVEGVVMVKGEGSGTEPTHVNFVDTGLEHSIPEERVAKR